MSLRAVWDAIDRDLNRTRPSSAILVIVPFIPAGLIDVFDGPQHWQDTAALIGAPFGVAILIYILGRGAMNVGAAFQAHSDSRPQSRDDEDKG